MQLDTIRFQNFRQFREGELAFAQDTDRNVTVVHGQNGAGKTTLLNALTWVLYGEVDFETRPDRLVNEGAIARASPNTEIEVRVELIFEHEGTRYRAVRSVPYTKRSAGELDGEMGDSDFSLASSSEGDWRPLSDGQTRVKQILPDRLRHLFFFDGEDIEELAGVDNQAQIQKAIQNIMGLTVLERSIRHLGAVADRFEAEYRDRASQEVGAVFDKRDKLQRQIEQKESQIADRRAKRDDLRDRIDDLTAQLEAIDESKQFERRRQDALDDKRRVEDRLRRLDEEIAGTIAESGTLVLATPILSEAAAELDDLRNNDLLGADVSAEFLDRLLDRGECVCGRPLEDHSIYYERIADLKPEVATTGVGETAVRVITAAEHARDSKEDVLASLGDALDRRGDLVGDRRAHAEEIERIESDLSSLTTPGDGGKSPAELKREREQAASLRDDVVQDIGKLEAQIESLRADLEEVEAELDRVRKDQQRADLAERRWQAAEQARRSLESSFEQLQNAVRKLADQRVGSMFDAIAHKDLEAEITDEFELKIRQRVGDQWTELSKGTGETQIASLAFIGSLVAIARERYEKDADAQYFTGGIYPLVMDSPFGALDDEHRRQVATLIPELGNQVVVLVTDSQWGGPVEAEMQSRAGAQYTLDFDDGAGAGNYPVSHIRQEVRPNAS
jgi:DNA sulfur modification protein DndD